MRAQILDKGVHDRESFDCGSTPLNNYLRMMAGQQHAKDNVRTFVLEDRERPGKIIGFYSLTMTQLHLSNLPEKLQKKHQSSTAAGLIARLAVDQTYKGQGFGEFLLVDALERLLQASNFVAFPLVLVDAKDGAVDFYKKFGFTQFRDSPNKLFMTIAALQASIGDI